MAKRKDINAILDDETLDRDARTKKLLDLFHSEQDELRDKYDELTAENERLKTDLSNASNAKTKAEEALNDYKTQMSTKEARTAKETAYKDMLTEAGVSDKRIAAVLRATDLDTIALDADGKVVDRAKVIEGIKAEWADFITSTQTSGQTVPTPPGNTGGKMSKEDIMNIKNTRERQAAIAENLELFT